MSTRCAALALLLLVGSVPASAQTTRSIDIERFRPTPDRSGFLGIPGTRTPGPWAWDSALWLGYSSEPFVVVRRDDGTRIPIVRHRVSGDFVAQLGIVDRIALSLDVPIVYWQDVDNSVLDTGSAASVVAIRDPYVAGRVRILGASAEANHERAEGEGLAVQAGITLPFGLEHAYAGEGSPSIDAQVIGDYHFLDFAFAANFGYRHRFAEPALLGARFRNEIFFGGALQTPTFFIPNASFLIEVRTITAVEEEAAFEDATTYVEGDFGTRWSDGDLSMTWSVGMGWTGGVGTPGFRGLYGLEFAPRTHDIDGDQLVDASDGCERLPEDLDGFEDEDGCPDPDNDNDLIPDEDDRCPGEAADFDHDEDEDGCTDPLNDADRDGTGDGDDGCPEDAEDRDDFEDDDGCPDPDDDDDGVLDDVDACRREAEDRDQFQDDDGCPDPDNDGDAVLDAADGCPASPEDHDAFEDEDGCADPDNDRDGVADTDDRCPAAPEAINGVSDLDGCPDEGGQILFRENAGRLRGRVRFAADGSIEGMSTGAVDQLARHLAARSDAVSVVTIAVDSAAARASLTAALVSRGVAEDRFVVRSDATVGPFGVTVSRQ